MAADKGIFLDPVFGSVLNDTGIDDGDVYTALAEQHPEVAALARWQGSTRKVGSIFERDRYVTPDNLFDQMRVAQDAAENDDIVAGVLESTESLAFGKMSFECDDDDEEDIWNQIASMIDLDSRLREMWRELFIVSQFYAVTWYGRKTLKVSGKNPKTGVKRRRVFENLVVPIGISLLDPLKVLPVGNLLFNQEQLVYIADDRNEQSAILDVLNGDNRSSDEMIAQLLVSEYNPSREEQKYLSNLGVNSARLFVLNPERVWRHTATRPQYRRFADVRLKSVFELLDLKHQLREMDRTHLLGGTNFIVLVKKGTDQNPAKPEEVSNLQSQVRTLSRVPVIVGDHRLSVEIVTPNNDHTLEAGRYDVLDTKISARLFQTFSASTSSREDSLKVARIIARGMESRRHMLWRAIEKNVIMPTVQANDEFSEEPSLMFHPKQIALDFDPALASFMFDLRDRGDLSRATILSQVDIDEGDEARKRKREALIYDDVFQTQVPYSTPNNNPFNVKDGNADTTDGGGGESNPRAAGRTGGGNRNGGGSAPGTGQGEPPRNPRRTSG